jgi:DNA adenine methylase
MTEIHSPFRYPGGKFYARKLLLEHIPEHNCYIEVFCGGASVFFAKEKVKTNILNDKDEELINTLIHIRDYPEKIANLTENLPPTKEMHKYYKEKYLPKNNLERAARWFFLNRISFSGIMQNQNCFYGYRNENSMQPKNWRKHLLNVSQKLQGVLILNKDYKEIINSAPVGAFLFLDPTYYDRDQEKFYNHTFKKNEHLELMNLLKENNNKFKFLMTYDDHEDIRKMYQWTHAIMDKEWNYMLSRSDDQRKNTDNSDRKIKGKRQKGKEIFILNYSNNNSNTNFSMPEVPKLKVKPQTQLSSNHKQLTLKKY